MIKEGVVKIGETPCVITGKPCACVSGTTKCGCDMEALADQSDDSKLRLLKDLGEDITTDAE